MKRIILYVLLFLQFPIISSSTLNNKTNNLVLLADINKMGNIDTIDINSLNTVIMELNKQLIDNPYNINVLMKLAYIYKKLGIFTESKKFYEKALKIEPKNKWIYFEIAQVLLEEQNFEEAKKNLEKAISLDNKFIEAYFSLAMFYVEMKSGTRIEKTLKKILELEPDNPSALNNLGVYYMQEGRISEGMELFKKVLNKEPNNADALANIGSVQAKEGNINEAIKSLNNALKENPDQDVALTNLGKVYFSLGAFEDALPFIKKALLHNPNDFSLRYLLTFVYFKEGSLDKAIAQQLMLLGANLNSSLLENVNLMLSEIYLVKKEYSKSITYASKVINANNENLEAYIVLGIAYNKLGESANTIDCWEKAIKLIEKSSYFDNNIFKNLDQEIIILMTE